MVGSAARRALESAPGSDELFELDEFPAAIVCAHCGSADCTGCGLGVEESTHASQVVAIVPWERPGLGFPRRLWATASLATMNSDKFFAALPEGDPWIALRFAMIAELLAASGLALASLPAIWLLLGKAPLIDHLAQATLVRVFALGIPGLAAVMVFLHGLWGGALDLAARRLGTPVSKARGLRFGLYSCGWDLVTLPVGLVALALFEGPRSALRAIPLGITVPSRAAEAYLKGVHRLEPPQVRAAMRFAGAVAGVPVVAAATLIGIVVLGLML